MPTFDLKVLWTVNMPTQDAEDQLLAHAQAAGCNAVAIRTSNTRLPDAIARFHEAGMKVYGWRWPARSPVHSPPNYYAPDQAHYVANTLIPKGLDGFIADIESDNDGKPTDWDDASWAPVAKQLCDIITQAAPAGFTFALTAGCTQPTGNPHIPWAVFTPYCSCVMPQAYWRWKNPTTGLPAGINGKSPVAALAKANEAWTPTFPGKPIVPIMGELIYATPEEIAAYGAAIAQTGVRQFHAYTDGNDVPAANLHAIALL